MRRGAVATYRSEQGFEAVSRILGVAGDTVAMHDGVPTVNRVAQRGVRPLRSIHPVRAGAGDPAEFAWQRAHLPGDTAGYAPTLRTWGPLVVPRGHVFMLGDNHEASLDSRYLGFIREDAVTGRAAWIYFSREPLTGEIYWNRVGRSIR